MTLEMTGPSVADWCVSGDGVSVCGTRMREYRRRPLGERWCFKCRTRHDFYDVISVPDGPSYYGPSSHVEGLAGFCTDLFPGYVREGQ